MREGQAIDALVLAFVQGWNALAPPTIPVVIDGELASTADRWVRVSVAPMLRNQATMGPYGARRFEDRGMLQVQLFADAIGGLAPLLAMADRARAAIEGRDLGDGLHTYAGSSRSAPSDGRWLMWIVSVPYLFDDQR